MAQLSADCFSTGEVMMTAAEALALLGRRLSAVVGSQRVELRHAAGRVLAEDIVARCNVPPHDNAAVDGYAVFFDDLLADRETRLRVTGRVAAGHPLGRAARRGDAIRIFTGAPVPDGLDTVLMQEDCAVEGETVVIRPGIARGANLRRAGEDVTKGATILCAGLRLRPQDVGLAASIGRRELVVRERLGVALFSTGDEICEPGRELPPGCVYDANRHTLAALLDSLGCAVDDLGILPDRRQAIADAMEAAARDHQLIVGSGGVSTGEEDHVRQVVESLGTLHFWRLAIQPGRPLALGQVGHVPFIGLPGNPAAMMVTFLRFARPAILILAGCTDIEPRTYRVRAGFDHRKKPNRREWVRVRLVAGEDGTTAAIKFPRAGAGILSSMVEADGLVELPEELTHLAAGAMVDFLPFNEVR